MTRAKKEKPWEPMFRRIRAVYRSEGMYSPKPTEADLDSIEAQLGMKFPASYRAFTQEFGLGGELLSLPRIYELVLPPGAPDWWDSVVDRTRDEREFHEEHADHVDNGRLAERIQRMIVFAADSGYETWIFDPAEVTDARWRECRIYAIFRDGRVTAVADSFADWLRYIDEHFRGESEEEEDPEDETEPPYPIVMKPDSADPNQLFYRRFIKRNESVEALARRGQEFVSDKPEELRRLALSPDAFTADMFFLPEGEVWRPPAGAYRRCGGRVEQLVRYGISRNLLSACSPTGSS
jgi:hypothetical protein